MVVVLICVLRTNSSNCNSRPKERTVRRHVCPPKQGRQLQLATYESMLKVYRLLCVAHTGEQYYKSERQFTQFKKRLGRNSKDHKTRELLFSCIMEKPTWQDSESGLCLSLPPVNYRFHILLFFHMSARIMVLSPTLSFLLSRFLFCCCITNWEIPNSGQWY